MKRYLLNDIPPDSWRRFKAKAALKGRTIRQVLLEAIENYIAGFKGTGKNNHDKGEHDG